MKMDLGRYKEETAFVLGYSGGTGKEIARILLERDLFKSVVLIGRRLIDYKDEPLFQKGKQVVVDFDKIEEYSAAFEGTKVGFCALASSPFVEGFASVRRVDHDYTVNAAKVARNAGCEHFCFVSAVGSIKGEAEKDIKALKFPRFTIGVPAVITNKETRTAKQKFYDGLIAPAKCISPGRFDISANNIAKALINDVFEKANESDYVIKYNNAQLNEQAKKFNANFKVASG